MLYGQIAWLVESRVEPVSSGRPAAILAVLAGHQPDWVPASQLIHEIWETWPRSGANAVQRNISRLRSHLRQIGVDDQAIETSANGYRLAPSVNTDLGEIGERLKRGEVLSSGPSQGLGPHWWAEPLPGLSWDHHGDLRGSLVIMATQARKLWVAAAIASNRTEEAARILCPMLVRNPYDTDVMYQLADIAEASSDTELGQSIRSALLSAMERANIQNESLQQRMLALDPGRSPLLAPRYQELDSAANAWLHNDLDRAFEALEARSKCFGQDVVGRAARCLTWISSDEPWARLRWSELVGYPPAMAELAERCLVSLDAFALEHNENAIRISNQEVEQSSAIAEQVRSLCVRFMVGLGHPIDDQQIETVDRLASVDDPWARTEALRFSGILSVKRNEFDQARSLFKQSVELGRKLRPVTFDDFDQIAEVVISTRTVTSPANNQPYELPAPGLFALVSTQATVEMATLWRLLTEGQPSRPDWVDGLLQRTLRAMPLECCNAYKLLFELSNERASPTESTNTSERARGLLQSIQGLPSNRHRQATLVALSRYAILRSDHEMAGELHQLLSPWLGEQLGIWPLEVLIGTADDLLLELDAVVK